MCILEFASLTISFFFYTVGYDISGNKIKDILSEVKSITKQDIASNAFIEFQDISAKCLASATLSANLDTLGIDIDNATTAIGFGIGLLESNKVYFSDITSVLQSLRSSSWQKVGVLDVSLPITAKVPKIDLQLTPLISISSKDLFGDDPPAFSVDFNVE